MRAHPSFGVCAAVLIFCVILPFARAGNAIQFSADEQTFSGEGINYRRLIFKDDKRTVFYQPPNGWSCRLTDNQLHMIPPDKSLCEGRIESSATLQSSALDENAVAALVQQVVATLPGGSQHAAVLKQEQNGLLVDGNPTVEVLVSYEVFGESFRRSVLLIATSANQIRFQFTARKADFEKLYGAFRSSIGTWAWQPTS